MTAIYLDFNSPVFLTIHFWTSTNITGNWIIRESRPRPKGLVQPQIKPLTLALLPLLLRLALTRKRAKYHLCPYTPVCGGGVTSVPRIAPCSIQISPRRLTAPTSATSHADPGLTPRTHVNRIRCASAATPATPAHAMNPDLRDYFARRAIPRCPLRNYRTSPAPNDRHYEPFQSQYLPHHPSPPPSSPLPRPATPRQSLH